MVHPITYYNTRVLAAVCWLHLQRGDTALMKLLTPRLASVSSSSSSSASDLARLLVAHGADIFSKHPQVSQA